MGIHFSRFTAVLSGIWLFNFSHNFISTYSHKYFKDFCICQKCYEIYRDKKVLLVTGLTTLFPLVMYKIPIYSFF